MSRGKVPDNERRLVLTLSAERTRHVDNLAARWQCGRQKVFYRLMAEHVRRERLHRDRVRVSTAIRLFVLQKPKQLMKCIEVGLLSTEEAMTRIKLDQLDASHALRSEGLADEMLFEKFDITDLEQMTEDLRNEGEFKDSLGDELIAGLVSPIQEED